MANHKDAIKRARQSEDARLRNRHYRSLMRNRIKKLQRAIEDGDVAEATSQLAETVSTIQRVAQKGVIHRKQADRRVSRLYKAINKLNADQKPA